MYGVAGESIKEMGYVHSRLGRATVLTRLILSTSVNSGNARDSGLIPGSQRFPGGEKATDSGILAWEISRTVEPGRLQYMGCKESYVTEQLGVHATFVQQNILV